MFNRLTYIYLSIQQLECLSRKCVRGRLRRCGRGDRQPPRSAVGTLDMIIHGPALVVRNNDVDTDVLYHGSYLNILDPEDMKGHLFEGLDPSLVELRTQPVEKAAAITKGAMIFSILIAFPPQSFDIAGKNRKLLCRLRRSS